MSAFTGTRDPVRGQEDHKTVAKDRGKLSSKKCLVHPGKCSLKSHGAHEPCDVAAVPSLGTSLTLKSFCMADSTEQAKCLELVF